MAFWCPEGFHENDLFEVVRDVAGDLVERVDMIDEFEHPKTGRTSQCYRITYRSMDRNLMNEEVDEMQWQVRDKAENQLAVELR
jgi:phenylalanyl-tRNA synthetase alpha chain